MAEELKRHNIVFSLDLNKHPKDATNLSLINAENFKVSEDGASLISDKNLLENTIIKDKLNEYYKNNDYNIIYCISSNNEIVLFVISNYVEDTYYDLDIFRYSEILNICSDSIIPSEYEKMKYYGGKFSGTFTYNVKSELIITFCEYDSTFPTEFEWGEPMKIINLGYWDKNDNEENILINDSNLNPKTFPICPEVSIPEISEWSIEKGLSKKGWYHFYIRYKINNYDYTQWFDFGRSFYLDDIIDQTIFNYKAIEGITATTTADWRVDVKCSNESDICNKTIKFQLNNLSKLYKYYQIGFTCSTKTYTDCKITNDINIINNTFILIYKNCDEYYVNNLLNIYNNYYNVKNIINYNNRLYITNYKIKKDINNLPNNINFKIISSNNNNNSNTINIYFNNEIKTITLSTDNNGNKYIFAKDLYNVKKLYSYQSKSDNQLKKTGITSGNDESRFNEMWNDIIFKNSTTFNNIDNKDGIYIFNNINKTYLLRANLKNHTFYEKNSTIRKGETYKKITNTWCKRITIFYRQYYNIEDISECKFIYDKNNGYLISNELSNNILVIGTNNPQETKESYPEIPADFVEYPELNNLYFEQKNINKTYELNNKFTLIPRQPYLFFIHYIDKYGQISEGISIRNISYESANYNDGLGYYKYNNENYITIGVSLSNNLGYDYTYAVYILTKLDEPLPIFNGNNFGSYKLDLKKVLYNIVYACKQSTNVFVTYNELDNYIAYKDRDKDISFKQLFDENLHNNVGNLFWEFTDDNYKTLKASDINLLNIFKNKRQNSGYIDDNLFIINNDDKESFIEFNNINIPNNYISYFFSYEKLDKTLIWSGLVLNNKIESNYDNFSFYSDALNYSDNINLGINIDNNNTILNNVEYKVANSFRDNNYGLSTSLKVPSYDDDGNIIYDDNGNIIYNVELGEYLYKYPIGLYQKNNKILIRISEITNNSMLQVKTYGFYSYTTPIVVDKAFRINGSNILIDAIDVNTMLSANPFFTNIFIEKFQYVPDSSKQINNPPKIFKTITNNVKYDEPDAKFYDSYLFLPQDTVDLFKNNALDYDESILSIYTNYNENNINQIDFIKTIRRSTYIKDESLENGWRVFESDAYQNIQENKGEITRIEGIGDLLLVHTKDSLFQFDKSNLLVTENKTVQLGQQDTFDVGYKEIFTSPFGYGGLQDKEAAIVGEFGYIWYNNDFNKIYQYNAGSLNIISGNIEFLLNRFKPTKCRFVDDKQNKRLLIQFQLKDEKVLNLTYNYDIKAFISFYINNNSNENVFNEVYNTKTKFYILENNKIFNGFDKSNAKKLSFIINENYTKIKRLNFIKYKLYKGINEDEEFNASSPVEGNISHIINYRTPYSGYKLRVYNDLCDTGELSIDVDYKHPDGDITKPYYDLGNFTFNYLRDKSNDKNQIFGNFFIVEFIFNQNDDDIIEFESLEYGIDYEEN